MANANNKVLKVDEQWHSILGKEIPLIEPYHYVGLSEILTPPKLLVQERNGSVATVLPYIFDRRLKCGESMFLEQKILKL